MRRFGPGLLVTAAFIGPGTLTTATRAGAGHGLALVWAVLFSVVAAVVLQEMAARLGLVTRLGLGEALRSNFKQPFLKWPTVGLVIGAIALGNAAYEFGNLTGAGLGWSILTGGDVRVGALLAAGLAFACLMVGRYRVLETALIALVGLMSLTFIVTAIQSSASLGGLSIMPRLPDGATLTVIALIGTTVVPYNLFLHASAVRAKWDESVPVDQALTESRTDTVSAVTLGGLITLAIVATAASAFFQQGVALNDAADMGEQLGPTLGSASKYLFGVGLFAAGLTSAITAPLAAAFATAGALGWRTDLRDRKFRAVWAGVLAAGCVTASVGYKPVEGILVAQVFNGLLLPIVAVFLLVAVNRRTLMGRHRNGVVANVIGVTVVLIAAGLGAVSLWKVFGHL